MKREFTIGLIRQRGLGPPAWRRALGLTILIAGAVCAIVAMLSIQGVI